MILGPGWWVVSAEKVSFQERKSHKRCLRNRALKARLTDGPKVISPTDLAITWVGKQEAAPLIAIKAKGYFGEYEKEVVHFPIISMLIFPSFSLHQHKACFKNIPLHHTCRLYFLDKLYENQRVHSLCRHRRQGQMISMLFNGVQRDLTVQKHVFLDWSSIKVVS